MRLLSSAVSVACLLLFAKSALAVEARVEAAAQSTLKRVVADYRAKHWVTAAARLEKAASACGSDSCLSGTKAALLRDLGTMQFRHGDTDAASKSFSEALALESDLTLNPRYQTPDLQAAWDEATKRAAADDTARLAAGAPPSPAPEATSSAPPTVEGETEAPTAKETRYARFWVGFAGALDFMVFPSGSDLCKLTQQATTPENTVVTYCTNPDGTDFPTRGSTGQNNALVAGQASNVRGGLQVGDIRALVAFDYAFSPAILAGARVGYVMNAYPGHAAAADGRADGEHVHLELRGTYLFGDAPLATIGFAPMVFAGGGMSEFDASVTSTVAFQNVVGTQRVNVWMTDGPWFLMAGGGFRYQFSLRTAFTGAIRVNASFLGNGLLPTVGPEVGFQYGL